jgi:putative hydrolase of the HAD superfamily
MTTRPRWTIGFDADDTLWHNERFFQVSQDHLVSLLSEYAEPADLKARLVAAERRNLGHYGFGIKGFTLSMIETAIEVSEGRVPATVIAALLNSGREMLRHPVELLPHVRETLTVLAPLAELVLITKGDLLDQERKLAQSGLGDHFDAVEIVSHKTADTYAKIFARHDTARCMMVGNSLKSDVIPALEVGAWGIYIPHDLTWALEHAEDPTDHPRFHRLDDLGALPALVSTLG